MKSLPQVNRASYCADVRKSSLKKTSSKSLKTASRPNLSLKLDGFVPYRLSIASNVVSDLIATSYRSLFGLNINEWRLITVLAEMAAATPLDLGEATQLDKVSVSRAASELIERGLIRRKAHPEDKRSHLLSLSKEGSILYAQVAPKALSLEKEILAEFTSKEVSQLVSMLRRLEKAASNQFTKQ